MADQHLVRVRADRVHGGPNVRERLDEIEELALSIKTIGLIKPLIVSEDGDGYQILDGHRRLAALRRAGVTHVDVIVRAVPSERARLAVQMALASHSACLDPITEARTIHTLMWEHKLTREQIAAMLGRSPAWVRDRMALLRLTPGEQNSVATGRLSLTEAMLTLRGRTVGNFSSAPSKPSLSAAAANARTTGNGTGRSHAHCPTCRCGDDRG